VKTAISLPDLLFARAERAVARTGMSRSGLYARALEEYLRVHDGEDDRVTAALDQVYGAADQAAGDHQGLVAGRRLVDRGDWEW